MHTDIHPAEIANGHVAFDACIALAIRVPHCAMSYAPPELDADGEGILWFVDARSTSWARLHHHPDHDGLYRVLQSGSRSLWDEVHTSYRWWLDAGRPTAEVRFGRRPRATYRTADCSRHASTARSAAHVTTPGTRPEHDNTADLNPATGTQLTMEHRGITDITQNLTSQPVPEPVMLPQRTVETTDLIHEDRFDHHISHTRPSRPLYLPAQT